MNSKKIIWNTAKRIIKILPRHFHKKGLFVVFLSLLNSLLEIIGLGSIIPLVSVVIEDSPIENSKFLQNICYYFSLKNEKELLIFLTTTILIIIVGKNLVTLLIHRYQAKFSYRVFLHLTKRLQNNYFNKDFLSFKNLNSNVIFRDINIVPSQFSNAVLIPMLNLLAEIVTFFILFISLIIYSPKSFLLIGSLVLPVFTIFYGAVKRKIEQIAIKQNELNPKISKYLYQSILGYTDLKINNAEEFFFSEYLKRQHEVSELQIKNIVYNQSPSKVIEVSMIIGVIAIVLYGSLSLQNKELGRQLLSIYLLAAYKIMPSINKILSALMHIRSYQFTLDVIDKNNYHQEDHENKLDKLNFNDEISFRNVSFTYPEKNSPVLFDISLNIRKNEIIGIIGKSGSGKTTFINLLLGFLNPINGGIFIDNVTLDKKKIKPWWKIIGYVQQDVNIIDGTLAENIAFGYHKDDLDIDLLNRAIKKSSLKDVVDNLPMGYETLIGERGSKLSGGQKQRVGIARALYSGAEILVFDEATSALDNQTEEEITKAIFELSQDNDLTMIIVAHRITTLKFCQRIVEFENGEISSIQNYQEVFQRII